MPILDGYQASELILKDFKERNPSGSYPNDDKLTIIAVTAYINDQSVKHCYDKGITEVIHKPVNVDQINQALDKYYHYKAKTKRH